MENQCISVDEDIDQACKSELSIVEGLKDGGICKVLGTVTDLFGIQKTWNKYRYHSTHRHGCPKSRGFSGVNPHVSFDDTQYVEEEVSSQPNTDITEGIDSVGTTSTQTRTSELNFSSAREEKSCHNSPSKKDDSTHSKYNMDNQDETIQVARGTGSLVQDEPYAEKIESTTSAASSVLPDVVSTSTSNSSFSVVEDISNRRESSLRNESVTEMSFDDEEVFEGAEKFLVDKYNHKEDEVSKLQTARQFSTPDNISSEKVDSLKHENPLYRRLTSMPMRLHNSIEDKDNFQYLGGGKQMRKSLSDLGSSVNSSKDDPVSTAKEKRLLYSQGYHTGESNEAQSFEDADGILNDTPFTAVNQDTENTMTREKQEAGGLNKAESLDRTNSKIIPNGTEDHTNSHDSSFEIDSGQVKDHILIEQLFPNGITVLTGTSSPILPFTMTQNSLLYEPPITSEGAMGREVLDHQQYELQSAYKEDIEEENPHDKYCRQILESWDITSAKFRGDFETDGGDQNSVNISGRLRNVNDVMPSPHDDSYSEEEQSLLKNLQSAKQCDDKFCLDENCKLGKALLTCIKNSFGFNAIPETVRVALGAIKKHSCVCSELSCTIPWCNDFQEESTNVVEEAVDLFVQKNVYDYSKCGKTLKLCPAEVDQFIPIEEDQGYASMPESGLDFEVIQHLDTNENVVLALDRQHRLKVMAVKKSRTWNETKDVLEAIKDAKSFHLPFLVTHKWAATLKCPRNLFIATQFESIQGSQCIGSNIRKLIQCRRQRPDVWKFTGEVGKWLLDAWNALKFLHKCKILYLNWRAEHLLLCVTADYTSFHLKLCNFNSAVMKEAVEKNQQDLAEDLAAKLPPHLVPPEFLAKEAVVTFPQSDYWGFGCLIHELMTGDPLHWDIRHEPVEQQRKKIKKFLSKDFERGKNDIEHLQYECFEKNPEKRRPDFSVLQQYLKY